MTKKELTPEQESLTEKFIFDHAGQLIEDYKLDISHDKIDSIQEKLTSCIATDLEQGTDLTHGDANYRSDWAIFKQEFNRLYVPGDLQDHNNRKGDGTLTGQREMQNTSQTTAPRPSPPGSNPNSLTPDY